MRSVTIPVFMANDVGLGPVGAIAVSMEEDQVLGILKKVSLELKPTGKKSPPISVEFPCGMIPVMSRQGVPALVFGLMANETGIKILSGSTSFKKQCHIDVNVIVNNLPPS